MKFPAVLLAAALLALGAGRAESRPVEATLLAAGDIASCASRGDEATARLLARLRGTVAAIGDTVYESGSDAEYRRCYVPSWGRFKARTRPAVGNHEYGTAGAAGYFHYFGRRAHPPRGYYSYDLGAWHVVVLNSNCDEAGGCGAGSAQERWLRRDLAAHRTRCTLAYAHHPRYSSGFHGNDRTLRDLWRALYAAGADVVLAGHDHHYERFAPMTPDDRLDARRGLREFVVGTGGRSLRPPFFVKRGSQVRDWSTYGVLELKLGAAGYRWRFVPVAGGTFRDAGSGRCH